MTLHVVATTNVGHVRRSNEDHAVVGAHTLTGPEGRHDVRVDVPILLAVMDGMGGHPAGDVASRLVADGLAGVDPTAITAPGDVAMVVDALDRELAQHMERHPETATMGTTLVAAAVHAPDTALVFAVGDSLALWWADDDLRAVFPPDRAAWGSITQVLGGSHSSVNVDITDKDRLSPHVVEVVGPGRLVLSSDGLTDMLGAEALAEVLAVEDLGRCADGLVTAALDAGGQDNITVVAIDLDAPNGHIRKTP